MAKPSLINRDFKSPISNSIGHKKLPMPAILIGTFVLLLSVFYFKSATSTISLDAQQVVSISLPVKNSSAFDTPTIKYKKTDVIVKKPGQENPAKATALSTPDAIWKEYTIKSGDNLAKIFQQLKFSPSTLHSITQSGNKAKMLEHIKPGQTLRFSQNSNGECIALEYDIDKIKTLQVQATSNGFVASINEKPVKISHDIASGVINNSLFYDAKQSGLSDKTIMELANIFGWDIDFVQGLRPGDTFALLFESKYIEGKRIENGHILAAEFINRGDKYQAVRFVGNDGNAEYFSPDGKSMRKTFLRNPIDFARISSHFNLRRKHPVLNRIRAHKGVDYAASSGTPIKTIGDGRVTFAGVKGGYGRVVIVQHGQKYSSLYAHMSKYGRYKKGSYVKQGQVVGYVGKSGLATGPHLHYEFRVNGVHRNPLTTKFPAANPINKNLFAEFKQQTAPLLSQLDLVRPTQLALNLQ
ncbi:MAG: murein DD-endopeptidase MepM/ murein hydrolase activator NlpD [Cycloclasticus sp.]|jgi:murein DD-endopeptidase MepM/ murein hydrolase activator NlpD